MQWPTRGWYGVYRQFQQYFSYIVVVSFNGVVFSEVCVARSLVFSV
jgi:hypothetical protein